MAAVTAVKGIAAIRLRSRHVRDNAFRQAVIVDGGNARFVGLDDFGGIAFEMNFNGETMELSLPGRDLAAKAKKLKKLLSLPLGKDTFLAIIRYDKPSGWMVQNTADTETWTDPKHKKMTVRFADFLLGPLYPRYPRVITIYSGKNLFELKWLDVSLPPSASSP